jgi:hypothetical protein
VKKLILLLVIFLTFTGCDSGNNAENRLSENRIADIVLLKIEIEDIDSTISHKIKAMSDLVPVPPSLKG